MTAIGVSNDHLSRTGWVNANYVWLANPERPELRLRVGNAVAVNGTDAEAVSTAWKAEEQW